MADSWGPSQGCARGEQILNAGGEHTRIRNQNKVRCQKLSQAEEE